MEAPNGRERSLHCSKRSNLGTNGTSISGIVVELLHAPCRSLGVLLAY